MILIQSLKLPCTHSEEELKQKICKTLRISAHQLKGFQILRQSIDARQKPQLFFVYQIEVQTADEKSVIKNAHNPGIIKAPSESYRFPSHGTERLCHPPVIVGTGPAGLFCGYLLAEQGYRPILLERGAAIEERTAIVEHFWKTGELNEQCNVSFGEGGAGTFSDGKLNTLVKDKLFRNRKVLELFVKHGAPEEILYQQKPHIGTDVLKQVIVNLRNHILELGGEVRFHSCMTAIDCKGNRIRGIRINENEYLACDTLVLAAGHSARDTFTMLGQHITMEPKSFAVGLRLEHPQELINMSQYGVKTHPVLGAASYKLTHQASNQRGVYSFCMCPGGYVVNASSEKGRLAVNGMSYHARDGRNANAAIIITVTPEDFPDRTYLGGMRFQRALEEAAYRQCGGLIPVQLAGDFRENRISSGFGEVFPQTKGGYAFGNLREILPKAVSDALLEAIPVFDKKIKGFGREDAVFSGIESRTSSPLRMLRDENGESSVKGLYPCGEGAGYAGGITSAAMDGIRAAEWIASRYAPV